MGKKPLVGLLGLGVLSLALTGCGKDCKSCAGGSRKEGSPVAARKTTASGQQVAGAQSQRPRSVPGGSIAGKTNEQPEVQPVTGQDRVLRDSYVPTEKPAPVAASFDKRAPLTQVNAEGLPTTNLKSTHESSEDFAPAHKHAPAHPPSADVHDIPSAPPAKKFEEAPPVPIKGPDPDKIPALPGKAPARDVEPMPNPAVIPQIIDTSSRPVPDAVAPVTPPKVGAKPNPLPPEAPKVETPLLVPPPPAAEATPPVVQPTGKAVPPPPTDVVPGPEMAVPQPPVPAPVPLP